MLEYKDFEHSIERIKKFIEEQHKLGSLARVISPSGTNVCEFGSEFLEDYIRLLEIICLDTETNWISWFIFENDFGKRKYTVIVDGKNYIIDNEKIFYEICLKK